MNGYMNEKDEKIQMKENSNWTCGNKRTNYKFGMYLTFNKKVNVI